MSDQDLGQPRNGGGDNGGDDDDRKPAASATAAAATHPDATLIFNNGMDADRNNSHKTSTASDVDDDDDDDDDDWSRRVETDEHPLTAPSNLSILTTQSLPGGGTIPTMTMESVAELDEFHNNNSANAAVLPTTMSQQQPAQTSLPKLSLKEEAILRERQRRIETERARWKRQFALSNQQQQAGGGTDGSQHSSTNNHSHGNSNHYHNSRGGSGGAHQGGGMMDSASIAETVESTMVHPDEENPEQRLGFNMERFLRNSEDFQPAADQDDGAEPQSSVLMERFLNQPVVINQEGDDEEGTGHSQQQEPIAGTTMTTSLPVNSTVQRSVSFEQHQQQHQNAQLALEQSGPESIVTPTASNNNNRETPLPPIAYSSFEEDTTANVSIQVHPDEDEPVDDDDVEEATLEQPRGLTEADVQAMVAAEEASIANAPPSDRDDILSEVGELADFSVTRGGMGGVPDFSQGTPTTAMESSVDKQSAKSSHGSAEALHHHRPATPPMSNQRVPAAAAAAASSADDEDDRPTSPRVTPASYTPWSPPGKMNVSPLHQATLIVAPRGDDFPALPPATEVTPLLDVPPEIITTRHTTDEQDEDRALLTQGDSFFLRLQKHVQDPSGTTPRQESSVAYAHKTAWKRAWEQPILLLPYLVVLPTLWIVRHVLQQALCETQIPMERVVGWMAFLPLHLALSGQIQAHANHVTTQALRHLRAHSLKNWLFSELAAASFLGVGLAVVLGLLALILLNDVALAIAVGSAQLSTCVVAGLVGPWISLSAVYVAQMNVQQDDIYAWMVPLGAATQDLLGAAVWLLVSQFFLLQNDAPPEEDLVVLDDRMANFCG
eukprot:scaffold5540_cov181-Amphora_coffeaeformis.AAC.17